MKLLVYLSLSLCLLFGWVSVVSAQDYGVQFWKMNPGATVLYEKSDGGVFKSVYTKKAGKFYIVEEFEKQKKINTQYYDLKGHIVEKRFPRGGKVSWKGNCFKRLGSCEYKFRGKRKLNGTYIGRLTKSGSTFTFKSTKKGKEEWSRRTFTLGPFNWTAYHEKIVNGKKKWFKLVSIKELGYAVDARAY